MKRITPRFFLFSLLLVLTTQITPALAADKIGVVGALSGTVSATSEDGATRALAAGDPVYLNDTISSNADSKAQIMFLDKSALMINPNSKVMVDKFVFNPATSTGDLTIQNTKGALRFIGGALSKEKPVTIKTPVATIGIRGGIADTHVTDAGATDAIFVYGEEMTMTNANGQTTSVTIPGQGLGIETATDIPAMLPPERVMQHLQSFSAGEADTSGAMNSGQDNAGNPPAQGNAEQNKEAEPNNTGNNPEQESDQAPAGNSAQEQPQNQGTSNQPNNNANGDPNANGESGRNQIRPGAPNPGATNAHPAPQAPQLMPTIPAGANNFLPNTITNTNLLSGSNQSAQQSSATTQFTSVTNPNQFGRYVMSEQGKLDAINSGSSQFEHIGTRQNGRLVQEQPSGALHSVSLPWFGTSGYHGNTASNQILVGNKAFFGQAFNSLDLSMNYYQLQEINGPQKIGLVFGRNAPTSTWTNSANFSASLADNDLVFYDFLPDLHQYGGPTFSFFDYNIADSRLVPNISSTQLSNMGLAVDWNHNRFFTGHLIWEKNSANALGREMILAFGRTNDNGRLLDGAILEYGEAHQGIETGFMRVTDAYSAYDGHAFSGFLIDGILPTNDGLTSADNSAFASSTAGVQILQPVVADHFATDPTSGARTSRTTQGFAAGFIGTETNSGSSASSISYTRYGNDDANDIEVTTNTATSNVNASFYLEDVDDPNINPKFIEAKFGNSAGGNAESAFLTDDLYGAGQSQMKYGDNSTVTNTYTGEDVENSAIAAANVIADVGVSCEDCEFTHWGVWAGEITRSASMEDTIPLMPYVAGEITENLSSVSAMNLGSVNYQGVMYGQVLNGSSLTRSSGDFTAGINLNTRQLTDFNANFAGMNFGFNGENHSIPGAGFAGFSDISVHNLGAGNTNNINGVINGALFGPHAEELAGNFAVNNTVTGAEAAGVYLGTRQ